VTDITPQSKHVKNYNSLYWLKG